MGINIEVAQSIINMWYIMAVLFVFGLIVFITIKRGKFKLVPESKFQIAIEGFVDLIYNLARDTMGMKNMGLAPYIGSLALFLMLSNMSGLFAFKKIPTTDYSVTLGLAIATFLVVQFNQMKVHKIGGYFKEIFMPIPLLFPLNILEKFTPVLSMSLRLFGNITAGYIIMELIYSSLRGMSKYAMALLPIPLHYYFDIFDAFIQTLVFIMLTMVLTANATVTEHDKH